MNLDLGMRRLWIVICLLTLAVTIGVAIYEGPTGARIDGRFRWQVKGSIQDLVGSVEAHPSAKYAIGEELDKLSDEQVLKLAQKYASGDVSVISPPDLGTGESEPPSGFLRLSQVRAIEEMKQHLAAREASLRGLQTEQAKFFVLAFGAWITFCVGGYATARLLRWVFMGFFSPRTR